MKEAKEGGGGVGAFFDLDGTLVAGPSLEGRFFRMLRYRRAIRMKNYFLWLRETVRLAPRGIYAMRYTNKMYLRGVAADAVGSNADRIWFFAEALDRVEWHVTQGHKIVIVSGSLEMLARQAARELEAHLTARGIAVSVHVIATRLEETEGRWTGRIAGEAMLGKAKARAAERLATEMGFELGSSYAYGDSVNDRWLLASVGRPTVVNPSRKLLQIVRGRKWPAAIWQKHER